MAFIPAIIGIIASATSTVAGIASTVGGAIASTVGEVAGSVAGISASVVDSVTSSASAAISALGSGAGDLFDFLNKAIDAAGQVEKSVVSPIAGFIDKVSAFVNKINDELVKPITDSVLTTYTAVENLIGELHADVHGGIKGILAIPDAIAGALTAVDAQLGRAMQELGLANKEVVTGSLLPGMGTIFTGPLGSIATAASGLSGSKLNLLDQIGRVQLSNCLDSSVFETKLESVTGALKANEGIVGEFGRLLMTIFWVLPYLAESVRNDIACFAQTVNEKNPVELLGLSQIVRAQYRGILSAESAANEAAKLGLSADRLKVLRENEAFLPGPSDAFTMLFRGVISQEQLDSVLSRQALSPSDIAALQSIYLDPPSARETLGLYARKQAGEANFLPSSLGTPVPGEITAAYPPRRLSPEQAKLDWLAHWKIPQLEWWFTAWARGMRTREEFQLAAQAENIPPDVIDDMIPVFQETIQLWMVPDILAAGLMDEAAALAYLHYIGVGDSDSRILIQWGKSKAKAPKAAQAGDLAKLSAGVAGTMYADGIIDQPTYTEILLEHGYSPDAAKLTIQLETQKAALAARKTFVTGLVDEVNAGVLAEQDAISRMFAAGLTTAEVAAATVRLKSAKAAKAKFPSQAELDAFRKNAIIDQAAWSAGYGVIGFDDTWIAAFDALGKAKNEWA